MLRAMRARHPRGGLGSNLQCDSVLRIRGLARLARRVGSLHDYQRSIQLVTCSVALAMCFSTVLMLN